MTPLELGFGAAFVAAIVYKGYQTYTAYKRSPGFLVRKETHLVKTAEKAQRHHIQVLAGLGVAVARHNHHLDHADKLKRKLA